MRGRFQWAKENHPIEQKRRKRPILGGIREKQKEISGLLLRHQDAAILVERIIFKERTKNFGTQTTILPHLLGFGLALKAAQKWTAEGLGY